MALATYNVLIVDDVAEDRFIVRRHLTKSDEMVYSFREATTGAEALRILKQETIDCVVLDYNLPDMTGVDLLHTLGKAFTERMALVFLTGSGNESIAVEAMKHGAHDYLSKDNVHRAQLQSSVRHAIEKAELLRALADQRNELAVSEQRFRSSIENMLDGFGIFSAIYEAEHIVDFRIDYLNGAALRLIGLAAPQLIGTTVCGLWPQVCADTMYEQVVRVVETGEPYICTNYRFTRPDGSHSFYDLQIMQYSSGISATWRNVTAREKAEQERQEMLDQERDMRRALEWAQERFILLLEASSLLTFTEDYQQPLQQLAHLAVSTFCDVCVVDLLNEHHFERVAVSHIDPSREHLLYDLVRRVTRERSLKNPLWRVIETGEPLFIPDVSESYITRVTDNDEHAEIIQKIGRHRSMMVIPLAVREKPFGLMTFSRFMRAEAFNSLDFELAQELAHRTAIAIDNANLYQAARKAIEVRDTFLSIASHELKNPLTVLRGQATLMLRRAERHNLGERDKRSLEAIHDQVIRMEQMIDTLLNVSYLQSGTLTIIQEEFDLAAMVQQVVNTFNPTLKMHQVEYERPDEPVRIVGDALRLEQVIMNLLNNAVKYSPESDRVLIKLFTDEDHACVEVTDWGIGIPAEAIPHLFEREYRVVNERTNNIKGMGIGLYVVNELVRLHKGSIQVVSSESAGSTFTVILPRLL